MSQNDLIHVFYELDEVHVYPHYIVLWNILGDWIWVKGIWAVQHFIGWICALQSIMYEATRKQSQTDWGGVSTHSAFVLMS